MSVLIVPGTPRDASSLTSPLQEVEDDINSVPRDAVRPESIIPEVLQSGLFENHYHAGEVVGTEEEIEFVSGDAASNWSHLLTISVAGTGAGYDSDHRDMEAITLDNEAFGGVVVEWDVTVDRATSWIAPVFTAVHALSKLVIELVVEVCNDADTGTSANWYTAAGPFYARTNAVLGTTGVTFPITDSEFNLDKGINNPVTGLTFAGAILLDAEAMTTITGTSAFIDIYGILVKARAWCSDTQFNNMDTQVNGLVPVVVFDLGNSRLSIEHTRAGVLQ